MDDFDKDLVLESYEYLEGRLLDFMRDLPPALENLNSFSPRLADIIVNSCGLIDSILRQITPDPEIVDGKTVRKGSLNIVHYASLYAVKFKLPTSKSILLTSPPKYLCPFERWLKLTSRRKYPSLRWWKTHTGLKHDRIANIKKASLGETIESLCALHLIISVVPDFARMILRKGWVLGSKWDPITTIEILEGKKESHPILVETKLFVATRGRDRFPDKIEDFNPARYNGSERLIDFFVL